MTTTAAERLSALQTYRREFYEDATTDERRVEILTIIRGWAEEEMPESKCISCGHAGIGIPYEYALIEGHCYSEAGEKDYQSITKQCEYCFDKWCGSVSPDNDSVPAVGPRPR